MNDELLLQVQDKFLILHVLSMTAKKYIETKEFAPSMYFLYMCSNFRKIESFIEENSLEKLEKQKKRKNLKFDVQYLCALS